MDAKILSEVSWDVRFYNPCLSDDFANTNKEKVLLLNHETSNQAKHVELPHFKIHSSPFKYSTNTHIKQSEKTSNLFELKQRYLKPLCEIKPSNNTIDCDIAQCNSTLSDTNPLSSSFDQNKRNKIGSETLKIKENSVDLYEFYKQKIKSETHKRCFTEQISEPKSNLKNSQSKCVSIDAKNRTVTIDLDKVICKLNN